MRRSRVTYVALGVLLRLALLVWGTYQDQVSSVPYTDVDYAVYNDGARALWSACPLSSTVYSTEFEDEQDLYEKPALVDHVHCARGFLPVVSRFVLENDPRNPTHGGESVIDPSSWWSWPILFSFACMRPLLRALASLGDPFSRETYRYTPFLGLMLAPAQSYDFLWPWFGKLLFALADVGCAWLMWAILDERALMHAHEAPGLRSAWATHLPGLLWLLNPFPAQIATRGSAESLVGLLVLGTLYLLMCATPELSLVREPERSETPKEEHDPSELRVAQPAAWYGAACLLALAVHLKVYPVIYGASVVAHLINYRHHVMVLLCGIRAPKRSDVVKLAIDFALLSAAICAALTLLAWALWGQPYLDHAILYHLSRKDHRHNFSVYFLSTYLTMTEAPRSWLSRALSLSWWSFVPQLSTTALAGFWLGGQDLILACAVQTVVFVAWNKVLTSQYFLWYLWFLPVVALTMTFRRRWEVPVLLGAWVGAQALWLAFAYRLEFQGVHTFVPLWASSLVLLAVHVVIIERCLAAWRTWREEQVLAVNKSL